MKIIPIVLLAIFIGSNMAWVQHTLDKKKQSMGATIFIHAVWFGMIATVAALGYWIGK